LLKNDFLGGMRGNRCEAVNKKAPTGGAFIASL